MPLRGACCVPVTSTSDLMTKTAELLFRILLIGSIFLTSFAASAQAIHKCSTPDGRTTYSDKPCEDRAAAKPMEPLPATRTPPAKRDYVPPPPGWFEPYGRAPSARGDGQIDIPIVCRDVPRNAPKRAGIVEVSCTANDTSCSHNREPSIDRPRYSSLGGAAADACRKASAAWQVQQRLR